MKDVFAKALDILKEHGWGQNSAQDLCGCRCAGAAIAEAVRGDSYSLYGHDRNIRAALTEFANHVGVPKTRLRRRLEPCERVTIWNDSDSRRESEVLEAFGELAAQ